MIFFSLYIYRLFLTCELSRATSSGFGRRGAATANAACHHGGGLGLKPVFLEDFGSCWTPIRISVLNGRI